MIECFKGQIWLVNLDPTIGAEIKKTRPGIIVSNNINNTHASTVTIVPISDVGKKVYPFEVFLSAKEVGLKKDSKARCQQLRTIDKSRLKKMIGALENHQIFEINQAISIHLDLKN